MALPRVCGGDAACVYVWSVRCLTMGLRLAVRRGCLVMCQVRLGGPSGL